MKKQLFLSFLVLFLFAFNSNVSAQIAVTDSIYQQLYHNDSLIFERGFNNCELTYFEELISEDFEFFHDQAGITSSKAAFIESIKNGICGLDYKPSRVLVEGSLDGFLLKNNGLVYGAIQRGKHRFYASEKGREKYFTSIAKFTHIWLLEDEIWRLHRVYSFDHQTVDEEN